MSGLWNKLLLWLSNLLGQKAGKSEQRNDDVAAANAAGQEIVHAQNDAPRDWGSTAGRLRDSSSEV